MSFYWPCIFTNLKYYLLKIFAIWFTLPFFQALLSLRLLYKKDLNDSDNHNGVITHLEPDILECEVKWALGRITMSKASGGDGFTVELLQILKDNDLKVLHSICQQIWKSQQWPQDWKRSVFIPIPKKGSAKKVQTTTQLHSSHMLANNVQNSPSETSALPALSTSRYPNWIYKRQRKQRSNCQQTLDHWKSKFS